MLLKASSRSSSVKFTLMVSHSSSEIFVYFMGEFYWQQGISPVASREDQSFSAVTGATGLPLQPLMTALDMNVCQDIIIYVCHLTAQFVYK